MVGEHTHLTRLSGDVDLYDALRLEDGLVAAISKRCYKFSQCVETLRGSRLTNNSGAIGSRNGVRSIRTVLRRQFDLESIIPGEAETSSA